MAHFCANKHSDAQIYSVIDQLLIKEDSNVPLKMNTGNTHSFMKKNTQFRCVILRKIHSKVREGLTGILKSPSR